MKLEISGSKSQTAALYIHVPFCRRRCAYCDFNTYTGVDALIPTYVTAVCREIETSGKQWGPLAVPTIYFGGGTPSLLSLDLLAKILHTSQATHRVADDAEITLEANPGTVTPEYLNGLRALGVNRVSLGAQSSHAEELDLLGRAHTWPQTVEAVAQARQAGFDNLSLDLIFGLSNQTPRHWQESLEAALALEPEHLSLYSLTIEEGTPLAKSIACGEQPPPDDDLAAEMYEAAEKALAEAGFFHYEISNWARINQRIDGSMDGQASEEISPYVCRHNLIYWRNEAWLGIGAGAHSWLDKRRWANVLHPHDYITALDADWPYAIKAAAAEASAIAEMEEIDQRTEIGETMMMGLRLTEGVSDARFRVRFGAGLEEIFGEKLFRLQKQGLLAWDGATARLTPSGRLLGNQVFMQFL